MKIIENKTFDEERALYGSQELMVRNCVFDGPADGESALKESDDIVADHCRFHLRYPLWHNRGLQITDSEMNEHCRAPIWYSEHVRIRNTKIHGIKALRECADVTIQNCEIRSPEFGWSVRGIRMEDTSAVSEYFMLRSENITFRNVTFEGKYSFQYIRNATFEHCTFHTKDAFWHGQNITVKDSIVNSEYLAWYSDGLTLIRCQIVGTQPLCYCKNLTLQDCEMIDTDLCFEKSEVTANILSSVISVKNPTKGTICAAQIGEIILDQPNTEVTITTCGEK